jgi:hypothetical protein
MNHFWDSQNLPNPDDGVFPLEDFVFGNIYRRSRGNPRESIKLIRKAIDEKVDSYIEPDLTLSEEVKVIAPDKVEAAVSETVKAETAEEAIALATTEPIMTDTQGISEATTPSIELAEILAIDVNPGSITGGAVCSVLTIAKKIGKQDDISMDLDFEFEVGGKKQTIGGIIRKGNMIIGVEVPSVKGFDKPGGVAAYYAIRRLRDALKNDQITSAVLITPNDTKGNKYMQIRQSISDDLIVIELNQEEAEDLIKQCQENPIAQALPLIKLVFPDYEPEPEIEPEPVS